MCRICVAKLTSYFTLDCVMLWSLLQIKVAYVTALLRCSANFCLFSRRESIFSELLRKWLSYVFFPPSLYQIKYHFICVCLWHQSHTKKHRCRQHFLWVTQIPAQMTRRKASRCHSSNFYFYFFYVRHFLSVGLALLDWVFDSLESLKSWVLIRALRWGSEHGMAWHDGSF